MNKAIGVGAVVLFLVALGAGANSTGCASRDTDVAAGSADFTSVSDWDRAVTRPATESSASSARASWAFHRGSIPAESLGSESPSATTFR
jgi:hypothetical protein